MRHVRSALIAAFLALWMMPGAALAAGTDRVSVSSTEAESNGSSTLPSISLDARFVAFQSTATNLDPGDPDATADVFVRDRANGTTSYVSRASGAAGVAGNSTSSYPSVNGDGRYIAYQSLASNLDVADPDITSDVFVRDQQTDLTILVSRAPGSGGAKANGTSVKPSISAGNEVAFYSNATNLVPQGDGDAINDIYVRNIGTSWTTLVSVSSSEVKGDSDSYNPAISASGDFVAFDSQANNLDGGNPGDNDIFRRDLVGGLTTLVSRASGVAGVAGNADSFDASISADGRYVAFTSAATNLHPDDTSSNNDIYVRDTLSSTTFLVSRASGAAGDKGNGASQSPSISADGRFVAFHSTANNLVPGDTNNRTDIFVRDLVAEYTVRMSVADDGSQAFGFEGATTPSISAAGGLVAFADSATLAPEDSNFSHDIYVRSADTDGDLILEPFDNCMSADNEDQADADGDALGNACDADDDGDGVPDTNDPCDLVPEDVDGSQDGDGCPDPDNDLDGICDAGQTAPGCSGSDIGKLCFDPAGTLQCLTQDCRNLAEDLDAFKDGDGCAEPDNDNDGKLDAADVCRGTDAHAGADGMFGSPQDLNHNGVSDNGEGALTSDDVLSVNWVFEDYDGVLDNDGCHDSPGADFDSDGYTDEDEALHVGTNAGYPCGATGWPSDVFSAGLSANKLDIQDIISFVAPVRRLDTSPTGWTSARYSARWDLSPGPNNPFPNYISIFDITTMLTGGSGSPGNPPMFGNTRAFGKACPLPPQ